MTYAHTVNNQELEFLHARQSLSVPELNAFIFQQMSAPEGRDTDAQEMQRVLKIIRLQLKGILNAVRAWKVEHEALEHPLRKRYSAYEGALCYADLRRHWAYYRYAMAEYVKLI